MFLPVAVGEKAWTRAIDEVVAALSMYALRLGVHGRDLEFIRDRMLARLDRATMSNRLAKELTRRLRREVPEHLEISPDLQLRRVDCAPSGTIQLLALTISLGDAATIFNCVASVDPSVERLRDRTGEMREWEWGLLLDRLIGCVNVVTGKKTGVLSRIFRDLTGDGYLREAMIRSLDQKALKVDVPSLSNRQDRRKPLPALIPQIANGEGTTMTAILINPFRAEISGIERYLFAYDIREILGGPLERAAVLPHGDVLFVAAGCISTQGFRLAGSGPVPGLRRCHRPPRGLRRVQKGAPAPFFHCRDRRFRQARRRGQNRRRCAGIEEFWSSRIVVRGSRTAMRAIEDEKSWKAASTRRASLPESHCCGRMRSIFDQFGFAFRVGGDILRINCSSRYRLVLSRRSGSICSNRQIPATLKLNQSSAATTVIV